MVARSVITSAGKPASLIFSNSPGRAATASSSEVGLVAEALWRSRQLVLLESPYLPSREQVEASWQRRQLGRLELQRPRSRGLADSGNAARGLFS